MAPTPYREYFIEGTEPSSQLIELSTGKTVQFVFPAESSILVMDPHKRTEDQALFVRFKGQIPEKSRLFLDGADVGKATSPFKINKLEPGPHRLSIHSEVAGAAPIAEVHFTVK